MTLIGNLFFRKYRSKKNICSNFDEFIFAHVSDDSKKIRKTKCSEKILKKKIGKKKVTFFNICVRGSASLKPPVRGG